MNHVTRTMRQAGNIKITRREWLHHYNNGDGHQTVWY